MIGSLRGRLVRRDPGAVTLDVGGVGYELQIPLSTFYRLGAVAPGAEANLNVHTYVREGVFQLYGFASMDERRAFERLIAVSGVGPKVALAILSGIDVGELDGAVRSGNRARLERIPGIGRKTAERILIDLRDRVEGTTRRKRAASTATDTEPAVDVDGPRADAVSALTNLGYSEDRASGAVEAVLAEDAASPLDKILREALRRLVR
jgi:Holliday junction DNA helicase RuvA